MESTTLLAVCLGLLILVCSLLILAPMQLFARPHGDSEEEQLLTAQEKLQTTLETLLTTRTRAINRRLHEVKALASPEAERLRQTVGQGESK